MAASKISEMEGHGLRNSFLPLFLCSNKTPYRNYLLGLPLLYMTSSSKEASGSAEKTSSSGSSCPDLLSFDTLSKLGMSAATGVFFGVAMEKSRGRSMKNRNFNRPTNN